MNVHSDDESSFDLDGGVDLFIQDTQLESITVAALPPVPADANIADEHSHSGYQNGMQSTQVDNGEYSDEEGSEEGGDLYGATQVDDDYLRRLAESEEFLVSEDKVTKLQDATSELVQQRTVESRLAESTIGINAQAMGSDKFKDRNHPSIMHESEDENSVESESQENFVDFCIEDTQQPSRHSSVRSKQSTTVHATTTIVQTEEEEVATEPATAYPEEENPHLTVYDYVSLSAPLSGGGAANVEPNVFSALDVIPPRIPHILSTVNSALFTTATSGPRRVAAAIDVDEAEEPTQLDGSLRLSSGDSHSIGLSHPSGHSRSVSEHSAHSCLLSGEAVEISFEDATPAAGCAVTRADTDGEWLSTKNIKSSFLPPVAPTMIRHSPQNTVFPATAECTAVPVNAGESETQLCGPVDGSQNLDDKSLEELVRLQEKLSRAIELKAQKMPGSNAATVAAANATNAPAPAAAPCVARHVRVEGEDKIAEVPIERQQTSYGLSQPSSSAVSSLLLLKTTVSDAAASPPGQRKFTTFASESVLRAAVTPAASSASSRDAKSSSSDQSSATTQSPDSANRKFLKRKFGGKASVGHVQALAAVAEEANLQFEMSEEDSDEAESSSADESTTKKSKTPPKNAAHKVGFAASKGNENVHVRTETDRSNNVNNGSKMRRIVIADTQEDASEDEDAEFTADDLVDSPAVTTRPHKGSNSHVVSDSKARAELIAKTLSADIPPSFLPKIPTKFTEFWHALMDLGWFWKRGGGIVSYYYVRPNCQPKKPFVSGRDFFGDEQEVLKYVTRVVQEARSSLLRQGVDTSPPPPPALAPSKVVQQPRPADTAVQASASARASSQVPTHDSANRETSSIPASRKLVPQLSTVSVTTGMFPPDDPAMSDIHKIPWKWLWKLLRERNWTWDFGPAHTNFYFAPGFDIRSKDAVLGEHKFDSEDSVRRFVRKQNWPEFSNNKSSSQQQHQSQSGGAAESQLPDAYLRDPTWQLASHRKKRGREPRRFDDDGDGGSGSDDNTADRPKSRAKKGSKGADKAAQQSKSTKSTKFSAPSQKRSYTPESEDTEQATQAQITQVSPIKGKSAGGAASAAAASGLIFAQSRFVVSGIPEKLKMHLMKDITRLGGKILPTVPVDGNETQDDVVLDAKTGKASRLGPIFVVSHPREFRKPNYLMALATGVTLVHFKWVTDSRDSGRLQPTEPYLLPSGCCALHAYNIFSSSQPFNASSLPLGPSVKSKGASSSSSDADNGALFSGVKVLNLAGGSWDNLLLTVGATTLHSEDPLLHALQSLPMRSGATSSSKSQRLPVDVILVDPHEYVLSVTAGKTSAAQSGARFVTPGAILQSEFASKSKNASGTPKSPASKLGGQELRVIQHCVELNSSNRSVDGGLGGGHHQSTLRAGQGLPAPIVVTTDWLVHCIAMGELLDHTVLDLFAPPAAPDTRPFTYKADAVTSTGERYSKYDIVYYSTAAAQQASYSNTINRNAVRSSPAKMSKQPDVLSVGKITGFVRRDEKSQLFARVRPLVSSQDANFHLLGPTLSAHKGSTAKGESRDRMQQHKELVGDPLNETCMVEVERLCGKAILLHRKDFFRVSKYSFEDESVYFASAEWIEENPSVLLGIDSQEDEDGSQGAMMRVQRSQDY